MVENVGEGEGEGARGRKKYEKRRIEILELKESNRCVYIEVHKCSYLVIYAI